MDMEKAYRPEERENGIAASWDAARAFTPRAAKEGEPVFSIAIPPPNVTGVLHVGHALFLAIQDVMVRAHRMRGDVTLWLPGTDHAALATNAKMERIIAAEGLTRHDLGREGFLERVREFVRVHRPIITGQMRAMGASVDWTRERYTLDDGLTRSVRTAFSRLYADGLIERGSRIVNWCPHCTSAIADDEVKYKEGKGSLTYLRYPVVPAGTTEAPDYRTHKDFITVATTRPETMLGDTAVAVHPDDPTWKKFHGKAVWLPLRDRAIPLILDESVEREFGSGAVKITPAHDANDFAMGRKHNLPVERILTDTATIAVPGGSPYDGLDRDAARTKIVTDLDALGLVGTVEPITHRRAHCDRCDTLIETLTSLQWFVRVDQAPASGGMTLKERALAVLEDGPGRIEFLPPRFEKTYRQWIENLHDWCISRQIWWGHQIPVWTRGEEVYVGVDAPEGDGWTQDPDTLDTWFSSGLWTFSTLGWPEKTEDLRTFHPTSVLETGYDIIFFWVARMILLSSYLVDEIPFRTVYLHGLVRDGQGVKMSKSLGNILDPLDMIPKYGTDALRLSLLLGTTPGNDSNVSEEKIAGFRNFMNKLWNVARFVRMTEGDASAAVELRTLPDRWIAARMARLTADVTADIDGYHFSEAGQKLYDFLWSEYADWYLEASKHQEKNLPLLTAILRDYLKLLHPFCPFITETLWQEFGFDDARVDTTLADPSANLLALTRWPEVRAAWADAEAETSFETLKGLVGSIRTAASEHGIGFTAIAMPALPALLERNATLVAALARLEDGVVSRAPEGNVREFLLDGATVTVEYAAAAVDRTKLEKELADVERGVATYERNLANEQFVAKAPPALIAQTKEKLAQAQEKAKLLRAQLQEA